MDYLLCLNILRCSKFSYLTEFIFFVRWNKFLCFYLSVNTEMAIPQYEIHKYKTQKQRMANNRNDEKQLIEKMCNKLYCYIPRLPSLIVILFSPSKLYGINRSVNIEKYKSNLWIELVNLEIYITFKLNTAYFSCI